MKRKIKDRTQTACAGRVRVQKLGQISMLQKIAKTNPPALRFRRSRSGPVARDRIFGKDRTHRNGNFASFSFKR
jgi:hypothetical protein